MTNNDHIQSPQEYINRINSQLSGPVFSQEFANQTSAIVSPEIEPNSSTVNRVGGGMLGVVSDPRINPINGGGGSSGLDLNEISPLTTPLVEGLDYSNQQESSTHEWRVFHPSIMSESVNLSNGNNVPSNTKEKKKKLTKKIIAKIGEENKKRQETNFKKKLEKIDSDIKAKSSLIVNTKTDIKKLESKYEKLDKVFKNISFENQFKDILKRDDIADIYILGDDIVFETNMLFVKNYYKNYQAKFKRITKKPLDIGKFAIRISRDLDKMSTYNLTYKSKVNDLPTIEHNQCCWGNIEKDIKKDLENLDLKEFVNDVIAFLQSPYNKNAYTKWEAWIKNRVKRKKIIIPQTTQLINSLMSFPNLVTWSTQAMDPNSYFNTTSVSAATIAPMRTTQVSYLDRLRREQTCFSRFFNRLERMPSHQNYGLNKFLGFLTLEGKDYVALWMMATQRSIGSMQIDEIYVVDRSKIIFSNSHMRRRFVLTIPDNLIYDRGRFYRYLDSLMSEARRQMRNPEERSRSNYIRPMSPSTSTFY